MVTISNPPFVVSWGDKDNGDFVSGLAKHETIVANNHLLLTELGPLTEFYSPIIVKELILAALSFTFPMSELSDLRGEVGPFTFEQVRRDLIAGCGLPLPGAVKQDCAGSDAGADDVNATAKTRGGRAKSKGGGRGRAAAEPKADEGGSTKRRRFSAKKTGIFEDIRDALSLTHASAAVEKPKTITDEFITTVIGPLLNLDVSQLNLGAIRKGFIKSFRILFTGKGYAQRASNVYGALVPVEVDTFKDLKPLLINTIVSAHIGPLARLHLSGSNNDLISAEDNNINTLTEKFTLQYAATTAKGSEDY